MKKNQDLLHDFEKFHMCFPFIILFLYSNWVEEMVSFRGHHLLCMVTCLFRSVMTWIIALCNFKLIGNFLHFLSQIDWEILTFPFMRNSPTQHWIFHILSWIRCHIRYTSHFFVLCFVYFLYDMKIIGKMLLFLKLDIFHGLSKQISSFWQTQTCLMCLMVDSYSRSNVSNCFHF